MPRPQKEPMSSPRLGCYTSDGLVLLKTGSGTAWKISLDPTTESEPKPV